jgi:arginine-tRNA-protein transferase
MSRMSFTDYASMLEDGGVSALLLELRDADGRFRGAMLADHIGDGYSAVYSFYDPTEPARSLGTWLILALIEAARLADLPYVYLGYWIAGSSKMDYKGRFRPFEVLAHGGWTPYRPGG